MPQDIFKEYRQVAMECNQRFTIARQEGRLQDERVFANSSTLITALIEALQAAKDEVDQLKSNSME